MKTEFPQDPAAPATPAGAATDPERDTAGDAFRHALEHFAEIRTYISYYIAVKTDAMKLSIRNAVLYAVLGIAGAIVGVAALVVSVVLLLVGIANALGALFGGRNWAGDLIVSVVVLAAVGIVTKIVVSKIFGASKKKTVDKYESLKREQREKFQHTHEHKPHA